MSPQPEPTQPVRPDAIPEKSPAAKSLFYKGLLGFLALAIIVLSAGPKPASPIAGLPPSGQQGRANPNPERATPPAPAPTTQPGAATESPDKEPRLTPTGSPASPAPDWRLSPGERAAAKGFLRTDGSQIVDSEGNPANLSGVNWFGFETANSVPHGLWSRGYQDMLDQVAQLGYNALRLPFSNAMLRQTTSPSGIDFRLSPDLEGLTPLEIMDKVIVAAGERGLRVILDNHRSLAGSGPEGNGLWYTPEYPESQWIEDWIFLAERYRGNPAVVAADLRNEPHGACWGCGDPVTDWRLAAEKAGNAILAVNPDWLIIVEGVAVYEGQNTWWGGNLIGAKEFPVRLEVPDRLVYSPHEYPESMFPHPWFNDPDFPANMPAVWAKYWGYIVDEGIAPVLIGEFGSRLSNERDRQWLETLLGYIQEKEMSWTFWSLNPNSGDTGGLLADDWTSVQEEKQKILAAVQYQPFGASVASLNPAATQTAPRLVTTPTMVEPTPAPQATPAPTQQAACQPGGKALPRAWQPFSGGDSGIQLSREARALQVSYQIGWGGWGGAEQKFTTAQDWSASAGLSFRLYGDGSGNPIRVEVYSRGASADPAVDTFTRYEAQIKDDFRGWKDFCLPWSAFQRRSDWQPPGALDGPLDLAKIWGLNFAPLAGQGEFKMDSLSLAGKE